MPDAQPINHGCDSFLTPGKGAEALAAKHDIFPRAQEGQQPACLQNIAKMVQAQKGKGICAASTPRGQNIRGGPGLRAERKTGGGTGGMGQVALP